MTTPKLVTATLLSGVAVTLAACGAGSSSHVVARVTPTTSVLSATTTTEPGPGTTAGPAPGRWHTDDRSTSTALSPQTLDQVAADLGAHGQQPQHGELRPEPPARRFLR